MARFICIVWTLALGVAGVVLLALQDQTPTFRSRVTVVPLSVRVADAKGKPITDLRPDDFTVVEDGIPQKIVQFAQQDLGREVQPRPRLFLLLFGSGRHVGPVKALDAAIDFVKGRLLPGDQVAMLAFNRATDFTSDHQAVLRILDGYKRHHEDIEHALAERAGTGRAQRAPGLNPGRLMGYHQLPEKIQRQIDRVFDTPGARAVRNAASAGLADDTRVARGFSRTGHPMLLRRSLDELIDIHYGINVDLANLVAGIRYLRQVDGEKHLIYLASGDLNAPDGSAGRGLATLAADARVSIYVIHTFGMAEADRVHASILRTRRALPAEPSADAIFLQRQRLQGLRNLARATGGDVTAFDFARNGFRRIDDTTRTHYLLGYEPANPHIDGRFRRLEVRVNRKGARVLHRSGYFASSQEPWADSRHGRAYSRIAAALNMHTKVDDLDVLIADAVSIGSPPAPLTFQVRLGPRNVHLQDKSGTTVGVIEAAYFCQGPEGAIVCEKWQTITLELTEESHRRFLSEGVTFTISLPASAPPRRIKVVFYDEQNDRLGSSVADVRRR